MNWLDIFCFTSVARTKSFSITARELMISQQAVSRHIRTLEDELGFQLFLRNYQSVKLSRAGETMLRYFTERDRMLAALHKDLHREGNSQCLHIGWLQWLGCPDWFRDAIDSFAAAHPDIQLLVYDLSAKELREALSEGALDVLLSTRYACGFMPTAWRMTEVADVPLYLLGSAHVEYKMDMLSYYPHLAAFAGEDDEAAVHLRVQNDYAQLGMQPRYVQVYPDMGAVCLNILLKGGISFGTGTKTIRDNPDFVLMETGRRASVVLCRRDQTKKPCADDFCSYVLDREAKQR